MSFVAPVRLCNSAPASRLFCNSPCNRLKMTERQTALPMWPDAPITNASHTHKSLRLYQRSLSNTVTTVLHEREELPLDWEGLAGPEGEDREDDWFWAPC